MTSVPANDNAGLKLDLAAQEHKNNVFLAKILVSGWVVVVVLGLGWVVWMNP